MKDFMVKFKNLRKSEGYTQTEFGKMLGLGQQAVSGIEKGTNKPSKTLLKFLEYRYRDILLSENTHPDVRKSTQEPRRIYSRASDGEKSTGDMLEAFSNKKAARECAEKLLEVDMIDPDKLDSVNFILHAFLEGLRPQKKTGT